MLENSVDPRKVFFRQQNLCDTLAGNSCSLVTITACPTSRAWKHLHQLRKSDSKTRNESDLCSCVSTHLCTERLMLLWVCIQKWRCVCVCALTIWQIFKVLGASELWHLLSEEELRSFGVCASFLGGLDGMTVLDSLPETYVMSGDKKLKELGELI